MPSGQIISLAIKTSRFFFFHYYYSFTHLMGLKTFARFVSFFSFPYIVRWIFLIVVVAVYVLIVAVCTVYIIYLVNDNDYAIIGQLHCRRNVRLLHSMAPASALALVELPFCTMQFISMCICSCTLYLFASDAY